MAREFQAITVTMGTFPTEDSPPMPRFLLALLLLAASLALATAPASASDAARTIDHEALWLMPRVGTPAISPDGRWSVVQVTRPDYDRDKQASHLWLVATDGRTPPRQLTSARSAESGVAWSPDSATIAFSARRDGDEASQIYLLDIAQGGEARAVTSISTGARMPVFSPDGSRIAFTSNVHPDSRNDEDSRRIAKEEKELDHSVRTFESFPIRNWDRWLDNHQARVFVQVIGEDGARDLLAGTDLVAEPGYAARTTAGGSELDVTWTPDGRALVFVASTNRHRGAHAFTHTDLWQVPAEGGQARRITGSSNADAGDSWSSPQFSPDGRTLYAQVTPRTERVYNATRVGILDWPSGSERGRIEPADGRASSGFAVSPNNRDVFVLVEDAGHAKVYRGSHRGGEARVAFDMDLGVYNGLAMNRSGRPVMVASFESAATPSEVVRIDIERGRHERLTEFAVEQAAALDLEPLEHFWFENDQGFQVHSLLVKPANFDPSRRYPVFVMMHGGPHVMSRDYFFLRWNYHLLAGEDFVVVMTNYRGSTGFGEAFAQSIQGDPLRGPANDINRALEVAAEKYPFVDAGRACAGGASYGGHLANWLQGSTDQYHCLVSHAGLVNLESQWGTSDVAFSREANMGGAPWEMYEVWAEQNPIRQAHNWRTPVLVTVGEQDFRVPLNNVLEYWTALQRMQVPGRLLVYPDENHWIMSGGNSRHFYGEVDAWLRRHLVDVD
jgi:dipeptidyl aminopeptidase/acylaminoacyl peptidase